jgi:hypothetical protein
LWRWSAFSCPGEALLSLPLTNTTCLSSCADCAQHALPAAAQQQLAALKAVAEVFDGVSGAES